MRLSIPVAFALWTMSMSVFGVNLDLHRIASGLSSPVFVTHAGDERLFIVEQVGRIRIWQDGELLQQPFLDIDPLVRSGGERGLLSMAFHPNYAVANALGEGLFWVNYTDNNGDTVIARHRVSSNNPDRADENSGISLLTIQQPDSNHNGGQLQFGPEKGPDGQRYFYIGMGDGGGGGDPQNNAQTDETLLGKLLRIDPSTDANPEAPFYSIPPDNPNSDDGFPLGSIWAKGLRNPWRFSFDAKTGDLFIADVGQRDWEEVNRTVAGTPGGLNYGWRIMEGKHCFNPSSGCDMSGLTQPVIEYGHTGSRCSVTGGYVYRGSRITELFGLYLFADFCTGEIFKLEEVSPGDWQFTLLLNAGFSVLTFGQGLSMELYIGGNDGSVYQLVDRDANVKLTSQFNLFSFPGAVPANSETCQGLINTLGADQQVDRISRFNTTTQQFESCEASGGLDFPIVSGEAYIVRIEGASNPTYSQDPVCPTVPLNPGINLFGYPGFGVTPSCFRILREAGPLALSAIQRFNQDSGVFETCSFKQSSEQPVGIDFPFLPGEGYMAFARTDYSLRFPGCSP